VADLDGDGRVVPRHHLDRDAQRGQPPQRRGGVLLRRVEEDQQAGQSQVVLVLKHRRPGGCRRAGGDRDHPVTGGELFGQRVSCRARHVQAAAQDRLRCPLGDQRQQASLVAHQDRGHVPLMIERQHAEAGAAIQRGPFGSGGR